MGAGPHAAAGAGGGIGVADPCSSALPALVDGAFRLHISLGDEQESRFVQYCSMLQEWGRHTNLTAIRSTEGVMRTLFLDALSLVPSIEAVCGDPGSLRVVDIGAGAGLPSLPLKIVFPGLSLALVESIGKKTRFMAALVDALGLGGVEIQSRRAEDLAREPGFRDSFDLALARAVSALPSLIELCGPFVRLGGHVILPKSGAVEDEVARADEAERRLGLRLVRIDEVQADLGLGQGRKVVIYEKVRPTPSGYPRRTGLAQSRPLGSYDSPNTGTGFSERASG